MRVHPVLLNFPVSEVTYLKESQKKTCAQEVLDVSPPFKACGNSYCDILVNSMCFRTLEWVLVTWSHVFGCDSADKVLINVHHSVRYDEFLL